MKLLGHGFAALALIVWVQTMTSACSARTGAAGSPVPPHLDRAPDPPSTAALPPTPEPSVPPPAEPQRSHEAGPYQRAIVRSGRSGVAAEFDGGLVIDGVNDPTRR